MEVFEKEIHLPLKRSKCSFSGTSEWRHLAEVKRTSGRRERNINSTDVSPEENMKMSLLVFTSSKADLRTTWLFRLHILYSTEIITRVIRVNYAFFPVWGTGQMKSVRKIVFSTLLRADSSRNPGWHFSICLDNKVLLSSNITYWISCFYIKRHFWRNQNSHYHYICTKKFESLLYYELCKKFIWGFAEAFMK